MPPKIDPSANEPEMCRLRIGAAVAAYASGDITEAELKAITERGGKLPNPLSDEIFPVPNKQKGLKPGDLNFSGI